MFIVAQSFGLINLAYKERRRVVQLKRTKLIIKIMQLFYDEGIIRGYSLAADLKTILVFLKYYDEKPLIYGFKLLSNGRKDFFVSSYFLNKYVSSNGLFVLSTNKYGLIFSNRLIRNTAISFKKSGGTLLFQIFI